MKIFHCIPSMEGGGAERQLTYLAGELQRTGQDVHVALVSRGPNWARLVATGATIHELRARGSHDPRLFTQLLDILQSVDPDVVQVWMRQMDILGGVAALVARKPLVLTERASEAAYPRSLKHTLRDRVGRWASAIVSNSEEGNRYWSARAHQTTPRYVIPNVVPVDEITLTPRAEDLPFGVDRRFVLFAGRFEAQKNIDTLLDALELALTNDDFDVICCGDGSLRTRLSEWIARNRYENRVALLGYTSALWSMMKSAALLVSPSLFEGSPNVVLEAMACRCPLVISDIPEHRALLDETCAVLIDPNSASGLAEAIRLVLHDTSAAQQRANSAFARLGGFTPALVAQQYLNVYRRVVSDPAGAAARGRI